MPACEKTGSCHCLLCALSTFHCPLLRFARTSSLPPTKEEVHVCCPCLSVCLLARLLKIACMDLGEMLRVDRCQDMDELLSPIRIIVRMPEPDCFLRYCYRLRNFAALLRLPASCAATRNFTSGKSHIYVLTARR